MPAALLLAAAAVADVDPDAIDRADLQSAQRGDAGALDRVLRRHADGLLRICLRLLGDRQDALDALQDAFVRVHASLASYDPSRPPRPWLATLAARAAHDLRRRRQRRGRVLVFFGDRRPDRIDPAARADESLQGAQLGSRLQVALSTLGPRERDAFVLRHLEGLETADVASVLGCRPATVRGHCMTARKKLHQHLERHCPELLQDSPGGSI